MFTKYMRAKILAAVVCQRPKSVRMDLSRYIVYIKLVDKFAMWNIRYLIIRYLNIRYLGYLNWKDRKERQLWCFILTILYECGKILWTVFIFHTSFTDFIGPFIVFQFRTIEMKIWYGRPSNFCIANGSTHMEFSLDIFIFHLFPDSNQLLVYFTPCYLGNCLLIARIFYDCKKTPSVVKSRIFACMLLIAEAL